MNTFEEVATALLWTELATNGQLMTIGKLTACQLIAICGHIELRISHRRPFLQGVVDTNAPTISAVPHQACTKGVRQRQSIANGVCCCVGNSSLSIGRDNLTLRVGTKFVTQSVGKTQRKSVLLCQLLRVLQTKIKFVAMHFRCIVLR